MQKIYVEYAKYKNMQNMQKYAEYAKKYAIYMKYTCNIYMQYTCRLGQEICTIRIKNMQKIFKTFAKHMQNICKKCAAATDA